MTKLLMRLGLVLTCLGLSTLGAAAESVTHVSAGYLHTCALTSGGGVLCWGGNEDGELGDGTTTSRSTPGPVSGLGSGVAAIAVGARHACALTTSGGVVCWGDNEVGQLGDGTTTNRLTPTPVSGLASGVQAIVAGGWHTCALTTGGAMVCWGLNMDGELGDGTTIDRWTPTPVAGLDSGVAAMTGGSLHTCALTTAGSMLCWGDNFDGQLGDGTTTNRPTPGPVIGLETDVAEIQAGGYHTCAVTTTGGLLCWGYNEFGQVGDGTFMDRSTPTAVSGLGSGVATVAGGWAHTCALTTDGAMLCWGDDFFGEVGVGTTQDSVSTPLPVSGLGSGVAGIAAGWEYTCAVTASGGVLAWGLNDYGQLGDGTTTDQAAPTPVVGLEPGVEPVAVLSLAADHALPVVAGTPLTWTVTATGGRAPLEYAFWMSGPGLTWVVAQPYSTSNVLHWTPSVAGTYRIQVGVRNSGSTAAYDVVSNVVLFSATSALPVVTGLSANVTLPAAVGTPITWTVTATGGTAPLEYAFWLSGPDLTWVVAQPYSTSNILHWTPSVAGTYRIQVGVRNSGSTAAYDVLSSVVLFSITASPPVVTGLSANVALPAIVGTPVTWTATATGGTAPLEYAFWLSGPGPGWVVIQPYSTSNILHWTPSASGTYRIQVGVRNSGSTTAYDAVSNVVLFSITAAPPVVTGLSADVTLPAIVGTPITWTVTATGGTAPLEYAFWMSGPDLTWVVAQPYSTSNTLLWTPSVAGTYRIQVGVRSSGSTAAYDVVSNVVLFSITGASSSSPPDSEPR